MRVWPAGSVVLMEIHAGAGHVACMTCVACCVGDNTSRCRASGVYGLRSMKH